MIHFKASRKILLNTKFDIYFLYDTFLFAGLPKNPSTVYISYDDGDTYENKTDLFKTPNNTYASLEKFYNHPKSKEYVSIYIYLRGIFYQLPYIDSLKGLERIHKKSLIRRGMSDPSFKSRLTTFSKMRHDFLFNIS